MHVLIVRGRVFRDVLTWFSSHSKRKKISFGSFLAIAGVLFPLAYTKRKAFKVLQR
jgi:hypothetical protein